MAIPVLRPPLFLENFFAQDLCDEFITLFVSGSARPRSYQGLVDNKVRECSFATLPVEYDHCFHPLIREQMQPYFGQDIDTRLRDRPMIYGYPIGVGFVPHHDRVTEVEVERGKTNGQPVIGGDYTLVIFCNSPSDYDGGELYFPDNGWTYKPSAGSAVVFPAELEYVHGIKPIVRGIRHTVVCRIYKCR